MPLHLVNLEDVSRRLVLSTPVALLVRQLGPLYKHYALYASKHKEKQK